MIVRLLTSDWSAITGGTQTTDGAYTVVTFNSGGVSLGLTAAAAGGPVLQEDVIWFSFYIKEEDIVVV